MAVMTDTEYAEFQTQREQALCCLDCGEPWIWLGPGDECKECADIRWDKEARLSLCPWPCL